MTHIILVFPDMSLLPCMRNCIAKLRNIPIIWDHKDFSYRWYSYSRSRQVSFRFRRTPLIVICSPIVKNILTETAVGVSVATHDFMVKIDWLITILYAVRTSRRIVGSIPITANPNISSSNADDLASELTWVKREAMITRHTTNTKCKLCTSQDKYKKLSYRRKTARQLPTWREGG